MITLRILEDLVKWYAKSGENRPQCVSCGVYLVHYKDALEVVDETSSDIGVMCRTCSSKATHLQYRDVDALRRETGGEERGREVEEALAKQREQRAKEFKQERAEKAARKKAEKAEARSRSRVEGSDSKSRSKPRVRKPKKAGSTKVRKPKR